MLVTEVSYPVYRPQLSSLYNTLWYSGNIVYVTPYASHRHSSLTVSALQCFVVRIRHSED